MQTDVQAANQVTTKFRKGKSGNPAGRLDGKRYRQVFSALEAELGGQLTESQRIIVDQIARLQSRRWQQDHVRASNTVAKLMRLLGLTGKAKPAAGHVP